MSFHVSTHQSLLARLASSKDDEAWREFHARYHDLLRGFARRSGLQPTDADDIAQEVLTAVYENMKTFVYDPNRGRFRGYLKTLALRAIWKKRAAASDETEEIALRRMADDREIDERFEIEWRRYHLSLATARVRTEFSAAEMRVFDLVAVEGRPTDEAARESGLPADRIYRIKSAILARIRQLVAAQTAEEG